ncbi:MAG: heparin/heparin-sulfate lyase HepB [Lacunisphaera sp.]
MNSVRALFLLVPFALAQGLFAAVTPPPVPPDRPRLYLRPTQAAQLAARLDDPVLQPVVRRLQKLAARSPQYHVEWEAVQYLAHPDTPRGRALIAEILPLLKASRLPEGVGACRITGRMMVTGAMVYDWLYPLLTKEEKQAFVTELVRLARTQECGYPPTRGGAITGHGSEAMMLRDLLSAGIAIHDEYPEMYDLVASRIVREHVPARNWFYPGNAHHQGDSYGPYRFQWDMFALFIFDRLGAGNIFDPGQRFVPYSWLYLTRPDGQRLRGGDTFKDGNPPGAPWGEEISTLLTASYYGDGVLLGQFLQQGGVSDDEAIFEFLWRDPQLASRPAATLPLSRYFGSPFGWMVARTGWDKDAVIAEMKINEYNFTNHQHLDAGAFQIYHEGALAIDSGIYQRGPAGEYGGPHLKNYSWRTIAHNSLLVYDPAETFNSGQGAFTQGYVNDGGQRLPNGRAEPRTLDALLDPQNGYHTGRVLAHGFGPDAQVPDYTLLQGDITAAYSGKVRTVTRSFVFLNLRNRAVPAALLTFDRVVSADPSFRKFWLLHALDEPAVSGPAATIDRTAPGGRGRLNVDVLLPAAENATLGKIGGPGREFWVSGTNYPNGIDPARLARSSIEAGAWRLELSPQQPAAEDLFLTVMQVTDQTAGPRWPVRLLEAPGRVGCVLTGPDASWVVLLRKDNERSADPVAFALEGARPGRFLVTDLAAGTWRATRAGGASRTFEVDADSGAGWFEGPAGTWSLAKAAAARAPARQRGGRKQFP